jgi:uncharacterized membrane protein YczE
MNKTIRNLLWICVGVCIGGMGCGTMLKAAVGVAAWDALGQTLNYMTGIPTGTCSIIFNSSCVLIQLLILRKNFKAYMVLQVILAIIYGSMINFVLYNLYANITLDNYLVQLVVFVGGMIVTAFGVAIVMNVNLITFPLEGLCNTLTAYIPMSFSRIRQMVDVLSILVGAAITLALHLPWAISVGTIIGMVLYGPLLGVFMKLLAPVTNPETKAYSY